MITALKTTYLVFSWNCNC